MKLLWLFLFCSLCLLIEGFSPRRWVTLQFPRMELSSSRLFAKLFGELRYKRDLIRLPCLDFTASNTELLNKTEVDCIPLTGSYRDNVLKTLEALKRFEFESGEVADRKEGDEDNVLLESAEPQLVEQDHDKFVTLKMADNLGISNRPDHEQEIGKNPTEKIKESSGDDNMAAIGPTNAELLTQESQTIDDFFAIGQFRNQKRLASTPRATTISEMGSYSKVFQKWDSTTDSAIRKKELKPNLQKYYTGSTNDLGDSNLEQFGPDSNLKVLGQTTNDYSQSAAEHTEGTREFLRKISKIKEEQESLTQSSISMRSGITKNKVVEDEQKGDKKSDGPIIIAAAPPRIVLQETLSLENREEKSESFLSINIRFSNVLASWAAGFFGTFVLIILLAAYVRSSRSRRMGKKYILQSFNNEEDISATSTKL